LYFLLLNINKVTEGLLL